MQKVSVIVPVYNGEEYIEKCINSILSQTYDNIELIIVNDGSTDKTNKIISRYKNNQKVKLIEQENIGISQTRNIGLREVSGEYVMFCDADDWLEENAIEQAVLHIEDYDLVRFNNYVANSNNALKMTNHDDVYADVSKEVTVNNMLKAILKSKTRIHLWNFIFKTSIIKENKITFDEELIWREDIIFTLEYILASTKIKIVPDCLYYYYNNPNSITNNLEQSIKNLSSLHIIRKKMISLLRRNKKGNYVRLMEQWFLNLQLISFEAYYKKLSKKEFFDYMTIIADANYKYYIQVERKKLPLNWVIFIKLLKSKRIVSLSFYVKLNNTVTKKQKLID